MMDQKVILDCLEGKAMLVDQVQLETKDWRVRLFMVPKGRLEKMPLMDYLEFLVKEVTLMNEVIAEWKHF